VKVSALVMFGAGYVLGTKAGRERYAQIVALAEQVSKRLEEYSVAAGDDRRDPRREPAAG
jgi:hypothetical protein